MTANEERKILSAAFEAIEEIGILHLTGGGEPFLHPKLDVLIETAMEFEDKFNQLMLFTNCTVPLSNNLVEALKRYRSKLIVQVSQYGVRPEIEKTVLAQFESTGVPLKVEKYYGEDQSFGGWVDFGEWKSNGRSVEELEKIFGNCAVTRDMHGNWRTRDGKVHWCSRSQRGTELGFLPNNSDNYVDLFDGSSPAEKRAKFEQIANARYLVACDFCSGNQGTNDLSKRFHAAEQIGCNQ
ncbi:hypothetical protein HMPREF0322_04699 [Desulfitobacterium hafniense DP7]|uniref:Radical SAM domain protein n=2 Tax=Desulfitobacterium hafniense TaxID=49338 RepID=G9XUP0_DESHA|nr:hypothetical protein HMPREF0322_04699 [Desulfitobacterium hafniense DP7]